MVEVESQSNESLVILGYTESFGAETGDVWLGKFETKTPTSGVHYSGYITFLTSLLVIFVIHRRKRL